jgi:hypothetical protein
LDVREQNSISLGWFGWKNKLITQPTPRDWVEIKTRPWLARDNDSIDLG